MNVPMKQLTGYVVLYMDLGKPYVLDYAVYPTREAADAAGAKLGVPFYVNAARVWVPQPALAAPEEVA